VAVFGLGPIGDMSSRIALHRGHRVIAIDLVPERIERARRNGIEVVDLRDYDDGEDDVTEAIREMTDGRDRTR
jgi:threonine dehydrogenase-like Zn-dependent dehydrogenase